MEHHDSRSMQPKTLLVSLLFWLGVVLLAASIGAAAYSQVQPSEGFQDLARFVTAMLALALAGGVFGAHGIAAYALKVRPRGWRLGLAVLACILGAIMGFGFLGVALPDNLGLAAFAGAIVLLCAGGILTTARVWSSR